MTFGQILGLLFVQDFEVSIFDLGDVLLLLNKVEEGLLALIRQVFEGYK